MTHILTIYRDRYTVEDDGNGGSDAVQTELITDVHTLTRESGSFEHDGRVIRWAESPARQAVEILRRENLGYGADGGDWFGQCEPSTIDYGTGEEERVTGHLSGFTAGEERAVIRMMEWLDARQAERVAAHFRPSDFGIPERYV
jgi:hypothetical protein